MKLKRPDVCEHIDMEMLDRVKVLGPEAAEVVKWAIFLEGVLHRIEEHPVHEPYHPEDERFADPRHIAQVALHGRVLDERRK